MRRSNLCEFTGCGNAMFLPCNRCNKEFCRDHHASHNCEAEEKMQADSVPRPIILNQEKLVHIAIYQKAPQDMTGHILVYNMGLEQAVKMVTDALQRIGAAYAENIPADEMEMLS